MLPRRRPKLNDCDCGRAKLRTADACDRCARIESTAPRYRPKTEGKRERQWIYSDLTKACDDFLESRGLQIKKGHQP